MNIRLTQNIQNLMDRSDLTEDAKNHILKTISDINQQTINILIVGATGCGKSSTINALFNSEQAKVGYGVAPETMEIQQFTLNNIVLWDSPGLGDGKEADSRHSKNITNKLLEKDENGNALIDLVLVILDGSSRDLGTTFEVINEVIIPAIGEDTNRLLVAINQCDLAMKGENWNSKANKPEDKLVEFLDEKVASTQQRIKEATGVDIQPIYYSAGNGRDKKPYNLSKLLYFIVTNTKPEKRAVYLNDINQDRGMWQHDDELDDYRGKVQKNMLDSIVDAAKTGGEIGEQIGRFFGSAGSVVGRAAGSIIGGAVGFFSSLF